MSNLYRRIEDLCVKKGTNITQMCKESGAILARIFRAVFKGISRFFVA